MDLSIRKFIIPAVSKPEIEFDLQRLNVRRSTLFPDLDNLAADLRQGFSRSADRLARKQATGFSVEEPDRAGLAELSFLWEAQ